MVFFPGIIIRLGGFSFVGEVAEVVGFVVEAYGRGPFLGAFMPMDAFVFRGGPSGGPAGVPAVLGEGVPTQACLAAVQRIFPKKTKKTASRRVLTGPGRPDIMLVSLSGG